MTQARNDQAAPPPKDECPKTSDNIRPKKITCTDWIALITAYLIASYVAQFIILGGLTFFKNRDTVECALFVLGGAIMITLLSLGVTFLISRKVPISISSLLGFAIVCFFNSSHIYGQARDAGLDPKDASLRKNIFFILITLLAWGLYWVVKILIGKLGFSGTRNSRPQI